MSALSYLRLSSVSAFNPFNSFPTFPSFTGRDREAGCTPIRSPASNATELLSYYRVSLGKSMVISAKQLISDLIASLWQLFYSDPVRSYAARFYRFTRYIITFGSSSLFHGLHGHCIPSIPEALRSPIRHLEGLSLVQNLAILFVHARRKPSSGYRRTFGCELTSAHI